MHIMHREVFILKEIYRILRTFKKKKTSNFTKELVFTKEKISRRNFSKGVDGPVGIPVLLRRFRLLPLHTDTIRALEVR